jgi:pSer/pThr/pTyr-binding forkhead associated (FHA) protein
MASAAVKMTNEFKTPTDVGVHHRLVCMTGPNKGKVYYLLGKRIIIGRADSADIQIIDSKISREHAEITFADNCYNITDLGSPNGVIINDHKIVQQQIFDGEKIVIGQSVFKYNIIQISESNNMVTTVKGDKKIIKPRLVTSTVADENITESDYSDNDTTEEKKKPKIIIVIAIILLVMFFMFDSGDGEKKSAKKISQAPDSSFDVNPEKDSNKKYNAEEADNKRKFESILHEGQREAREGNFFRAIEDFSRALQLDPKNGQASYYLAKAKQKLDEEVEKNFVKGKNEYDSKKFVGSIASYCAIEQLLQYSPSDERYVNATAKISALEVELGKEKGEIKCFEEKPAE